MKLNHILQLMNTVCIYIYTKIYGVYYIYILFYNRYVYIFIDCTLRALMDFTNTIMCVVRLIKDGCPIHSCLDQALLKGRLNPLVTWYKEQSVQNGGNERFNQWNTPTKIDSRCCFFLGNHVVYPERRVFLKPFPILRTDKTMNIEKHAVLFSPASKILAQQKIPSPVS
jgi:hypothetical protein